MLLSYTMTDHYYEQIVWWAVDSLQAPTITNLANVNDGASGGLTYSDSSLNTALDLDVSFDADYTADPAGLEFDNTDDDTSSIRIRLYGCTTDDLLYVKDGIDWGFNQSNAQLKYDSTRKVDVTFTPSLTTGSWSGDTLSSYPTVGTPLSDDYGDYCEGEFHFRAGASGNLATTSGQPSYLSGQDHVTGLLRSFVYRYAGSTVSSEGLRTVQIVLRDEEEDLLFLAMSSQPAEIDIAVYNNPTLTDATTATFFDGTPDVIVNSDYDVELTAGGTDADGDPCYIASTTVVANTDTTITFSKANGSDLPEGTHTCTLTPVRTVTPTRVTDGESTSFDFTGSAVTFSLVVDTTAPVITIDTEVADSNGYTASTTPTFDVTSDEAGTLTVGGSCSITGQDSISASTSTTITLDTVTDGSTYSDCTVMVTDAAGNASNQETLTAFTVDVTAPSLTVSLASPITGNANVTEDTTPDVVLVLSGTESDTTIAVDSASTTDCAVSSSTLTGGGVSNTVTLTHPSTTTFSDGLITCQVDLVDLAGNTADDTISFYVDQSAPVVSIASQPSTPTLLPTFTLDTDEDGTLSLTGDCASGSTHFWIVEYF